MDQFAEMRRHPRQEVFSAVMITPDGGQEGVMAMALDLSAGGTRVGLLDDWRPPVGVPLRVSFLFDTEHAIMLECRVTRVAVDHLAVAFEPVQGARVQHLLGMADRLH